MQDEFQILTRLATTHQTADVFALMDSPGWATLITILSESGEHISSQIFQRPSKRSSPDAPATRPPKVRNHSGQWLGVGDGANDADADVNVTAQNRQNAETNRLVKRVKGFRLHD